MPNGFEYYAFISYCSKDGAEARKLQALLERYRLPASLRREDPSLPKQISPVFMDKSDLVPQGKLLQSLHDNLDASRTLLVLCSPDSARSPWVDQEVRYFIETGRTDRILPVILDGDPHAADPARECFPPSLAALGQEDEPTAIRLSDYGERGSLLRIAAALLDLRLDKLLERDAAYRRKKRILFASAAALLLCTAAAVFWYLTPHTRSYRDYVLKREIPVGLNEVKASERGALDYMYRITRQKGRVVSLECVNSAGALTTPQFVPTHNEAPRVLYTYENGRLSRAEYIDIFGQPMYQKKYSADLQAVDFAMAGNDNYAYTLQAGQLTAQLVSGTDALGIGGRSDIIRYLQTYDEQGYLISRLFKRDNRGNGGTPACDANGVWGLLYTRDAQGRVVKEEYLDRDGLPMAAGTGESAVVYEYDAFGAVTRRTAVDAQGRPMAGAGGVCSTEFSYDALGRLTQVAYRDSAGNAVLEKEQHAAVLELSYDAHGFLTEMACYDPLSQPCRGGQGAFRTVMERDAKGHITKTSFFDENGALTPCSDGYAVCENTVDEAGNLLESSYSAPDGAPAPCLSLGCYRHRCAYENGRLVRIDNLDAEGAPMLTKRGYASVCYSYSPEGLKTRELYLDTDGQPVRILGGFAEVRYEYLDGALVGWNDYGPDGEPCLNGNEVSSCRIEYENGLVMRQSFFGTDGKPTLGTEGFASFGSEYDENGLLLRRAFYGLNGERVLIGANVSAVEWRYDEVGRVTEERYFDTQDRPLAQAALYGALGVVMEYDTQGNLAQSTYLYAGDPGEGVPARKVQEYDLHGNVVAEVYLDRNGNEVTGADGFSRQELFYDSADRLVEWRLYTPESETPIYVEKITNDLFGNPVYVESSMPVGNSVLTIEFKYEYDALGNETAAWSRMSGEEEWELMR